MADLLAPLKITRFRDIPQFTGSANYQVDHNFESLLRWIYDSCRYYAFELDPPFQRHHVWTKTQQIAWLEFHFRGGSTGNALFFNCKTWNKGAVGNAPVVLVDGKQRLQAIMKFMDNKIPIFGTYRKEFQDDLPWSHHTVRVHINNLQTDREVYQWYIDMNAGGTPHTLFEIGRVREMMNDLEKKAEYDAKAKMRAICRHPENDSVG